MGGSNEGQDAASVRQQFGHLGKGLPFHHSESGALGGGTEIVNCGWRSSAPGKVREAPSGQRPQEGQPEVAPTSDTQERWPSALTPSSPPGRYSPARVGWEFRPGADPGRSHLDWGAHCGVPWSRWRSSLLAAPPPAGSGATPRCGGAPAFAVLSADLGSVHDAGMRSAGSPSIPRFPIQKPWLFMRASLGQLGWAERAGVRSAAESSICS